MQTSGNSASGSLIVGIYVLFIDLWLIYTIYKRLCVFWVSCGIIHALHFWDPIYNLSDIAVLHRRLWIHCHAVMHPSPRYILFVCVHRAYTEELNYMKHYCFASLHCCWDNPYAVKRMLWATFISHNINMSYLTFFLREELTSDKSQNDNQWWAIVRA